MSNYPNAAAEAGDKYLAMLAQGQEQFVEFVRSSRELIPQVPAEFAAQASPAPFAMPSPQDVADAQYQFATKLLKQQETFTRRLYGLSGGHSASRSKAKPAARAAARRTASSKAAAKASPKSRKTASKTTRRKKTSR
jgi:hypothetical protein